MENPLISVIVPIYKVEKYLDRCVESIVNQTYKNLEIILIDDGSPDNCPKMCDDWAKKDNRIKVIHKENGGLSDARNTGLKIAKGEYIAFVDSDDFIEYSMILKLYDAIDTYNCDIASCRVKMVWNDKPSKPLTPDIKTKVFEKSVDAMENLISGDCLIQTVWNKLYKRMAVENIEFPIGKINEDEYWSWKVIANSKRVICINSLLYNYYMRDGSIMQGGTRFNPMSVVEAKLERQKYIEKNMPELKNKACVDLLYTCLFQAQRSKILLPKENYKQYYKKIKTIVKQCFPDKEYFRSLKMKTRVRTLSVYYCFGAIVFLQNTLNIGRKSNI